jgi:hypothetical protein
MSYRTWLVLFLSLATAWAQPAIPDTAPGHVLQAWLEAFNSGDRAKLDAYYRKYDPSKSAEMIMPFRNQTGGFDLLEILKSEPLGIQFTVKERHSETRAVGKFLLKDSETAAVKNFMLRAIPPGASAADLSFTIDAAARSRVIDGVIANLNEFYVFPEVAKKMETAIRTKQKAGEYDLVIEGEVFATTLTEQLQDVSHDKHLRVDFSPFPVPEGPPGPPSADDVAQYRKQMERMNCGFERVEVLPGNLGYVKFNMFADPEVCGPTAVAAMNFLAHVDAVIFDLRENGGGDPKMVALISSYLFSEPTHLNDLWERKDDKTQQYWTLPYVPGQRLEGKPVYVLTSKRTFSGAEEFTYNLKNLKRATIIGETTGGGAHPVAGHRIDDHFMVGVPFARAINPISKTNWEGTGVEPDIKVASAEALATAQKMAEEKKESSQTKNTLQPSQPAPKK